MAEIPSWFVVCMGLGTVFVGLICIILICKIMSLFFAGKKEKQTEIKPQVESASGDSPENREEIIAAVSAAVAEFSGTDANAIRVLSFKKL